MAILSTVLSQFGEGRDGTLHNRVACELVLRPSVPRYICSRKKTKCDIGEGSHRTKTGLKNHSRAHDRAIGEMTFF
ncbi:Hypothetical predicted protein [Octopus vulgaris]|uniref:Uncharacterized protein n=1 Tax=Octopus vulgaris TaxID=6645 RepID=A0AA36F7Z2_OCTVU|nr:Hypothetical predicted protein [Octopus vulgaris]